MPLQLNSVVDSFISRPVCTTKNVTKVLLTTEYGPYKFLPVISPPIWELQRLFWIAFQKNQDVADCYLSELPRSIIQYLILFLCETW